ncbi:YeeE/YedE family protein [Methylosinus sp. Sm6]|uniref:YeeE/YedE family protein n=1 Tax=Methylosinus sp. Sm6 TaxID=2866948 RepID=UPI001C995263|nr:YeeE/YedE family protein [Methylosinus sp. Sm6]MBY6242025.1 YeeE/YedE family protein [Methylosinus sp. Sm6]
MQVDWVRFTPSASLAGGAMIGLAAGLSFLLLGRIAGVSGVVAGALAGPLGERAWRVAFLTGLFLAPSLLALFVTAAPPEIEGSWTRLAAAGLLVGFGSRLGSGCTSGHGVCGLSRLSPRSLAATASFMAAGFATVYVLRHALS